jgi:hypothetical protein
MINIAALVPMLALSEVEGRHNSRRVPERRMVNHPAQSESSCGAGRRTLKRPLAMSLAVYHPARKIL